jgi:hypothetical protein
MAPKYESSPEKKAKDEVNKIAIRMGHKLKEMIDDLISCGVLDKDILRREYCDYDGQIITGEICIEILEKAYQECRYPTPKPVHENYPIFKNGQVIGFHDPIPSSEPGEFAYEVGLEIIKRIEQDFNLTIPKDNFSTAIDDEDWMSFRRIFFKEDI